MMWIVFAVLIVHAGASCRDGWMPHAGQCYLFSHDVETWTGAYDVCRILGGHLVEVETAQEDQFLVSQLSLYGGSAPYWIGLTDLSEEGTFEWLPSGHKLTSSSFTNWLPGQPDNQNLTDSCVHYFKWQTLDYMWNDFKCIFPQKYICEQNSAQHAVIG